MSASLVERERELEALGRLLGSAQAGVGGAVLVEGPPGIGKSSLLAAARDAAGADLRVLSARGGELEREFPFGVVRQLLEPVLVGAEEAERELLLAGAAGLAEPVLAPDPAAGAGGSLSALHGLYWLAANLAGRRPLLVAVDDVQWADLDSLRWLVYLARRLEGVPLALLLASRSAEEGPTRELLDSLALSTDLLEPRALSEAAVGGLTADLLGAADEEFVAACHAASGGNPFLLRELLGELSRRGIVPSRESVGVASQLSSQGVGRAVRTRLRQLEPACLPLARAVAVLGDQAQPSLAAGLARLGGDAASRAADALVDAAILADGSPLAFVHPLVRAAVYGELSASERADAHGQAARLLAQSGAPADRIALHLLGSEPEGDAGSVEVLRAGAESARRRDAHDIAAGFLRRALREPPPPELEPQVQYELGAAELRSGEIEAAFEHLTVALADTTNTRTRALVALDLASAATLTNRSVHAVDVLSEAMGGEEPEVRSLLLAMRWSVSWTSLDARRRLLARADTPPPVGAAPRTTGERLQLGQEASEEMLTGTAERARSLALRALGDGELVAAIGADHPALYLPLTALIRAHAYDDAERHLQSTLADARRRGSEGGFALASQFRAALCWQRGLLAELEADAQSALTHALARAVVPLAAACFAEALVERGDADAAEAQLRDAGLDVGTPPSLIGVLALVARAHVRLAQKRPGDALALLLECGRVEEDWGVVTPAMTSWRAEAALLLDRLGEPERARPLAAEAVRLADAYGSPVARGVALRAVALVKSDLDGLTEAVDLLRRGGAGLELARSLVDLGAALRRAGRRADARAPLREGVALAAACGGDVLAARGHEELVAAGARPRRDPTESRNNLTAGELRVARLAAEGMSNREVAQALFLTENTIQTHLRSAFRKLDISSRSQLARAL
jgi:DNA-binding CsgD family transcriptional regulator